MTKGLGALGIAVALAIALGHPFLYLSEFAGDAGIHLVYAENAADGAFFQYNRGEPSAGVTSIGYSLLLTLLFVVLPAGSVPLAVKALGIAGWYALLWLVFLLARETFGRGPWPWFVVAFAGAFPNAVHKATQGMENGLFAATTVAWALVAARSGWLTDARGVSGRTELLLGALGGVALLLRPEAVVFVAVAVACRAVIHARLSRGWTVPLSRSAIVVATVILTGAGMSAFHRAFTGHWLPTTGASRVMRTATDSYFLGPVQFYPRLAEFLVAFALPLTLLWLAGLGEIVSARADERRRTVLLFAAALTVAYFVFYSCVAPAYHVPRYMLSLVPFLVLGAAAGARGLLRSARGDPSLPPRRARTAIAVALLAVLSLWQARTFASNARDRAEDPSYPTLAAFAEAPERRAGTTQALLDDLERTPTRFPVAVAIHEVELRWFLDERIRVYSLDGRTDSSLIDHIDERGTVDHAGWIRERKIAYLLDTRDYNRDPGAWSLAELRSLGPGESVTHAGLTFVRQMNQPWLNESSWFRVQPDSHPVIAVVPTRAN